MADTCMYELDDLVWEKFGENDDHMVPYPGEEYGDECAQCDVSGVTTSNADIEYAEKCKIQGKEETHPAIKNKKGKMLEMDSWSQAPDDVFASCHNDSIKEGTSLASNDNGISSHCFSNSNTESAGSKFESEDPILNDGNDAVDNSLYRYPPRGSHISQSDNDLSFFDNDHEEKESSDLLYYGWPDIGNFEDVDQMFRSCDSTFGIGSVSNEDDFSWFSSSQEFEGSEDMLRSGFKSSCSGSSPLKSTSENDGPSMSNNESLSVDGSIKTIISNSNSTSSQRLHSVEPAALGHMSFVNELGMLTEARDEFPPMEQSNLHKNPLRLQNQPERKRNSCILENGLSIHPSGNLKSSANVKLPYGDSSYQHFPSPGIQQQTQNVGPDSFMQTHDTYMQSEYSHPSNQIAAIPTLTSIKSEANAHPFLSVKESSFASNQVQSLKSSCDPSSKVDTVASQKKKREKLQQGLQSSFTSNPRHDNLIVQAASYDPASQKNIHPCKTEVEGASMDIPAEFDSSNVQESSCMSTVLDEFSPEETSFRQLQHVMEKLDIRTKLCIRDGLYRLARSAEQRHICDNMEGCSGDDRNSSEAFIPKTYESAGFLDMETDTNPVDRSIARLLFHRPSDPSVKPANDALPLKPPYNHTLEETASACAVRKVADH